MCSIQCPNVFLINSFAFGGIIPHSKLKFFEHDLYVLSWNTFLIKIMSFKWCCKTLNNGLRYYNRSSDDRKIIVKALQSLYLIAVSAKTKNSAYLFLT